MREGKKKAFYSLLIFPEPISQSSRIKGFYKEKYISLGLPFHICYENANAIPNKKKIHVNHRLTDRENFHKMNAKTTH